MNKNEVEIIDLEILTLLEQNGFPMEEMGTILYKDVIRDVRRFLEENKNVEELKKQLSNAYSQFYFDIARNENGMGMTTFHTFIIMALSKIDFSKDCSFVVRSFCDQGVNDYGELAFDLASYMMQHSFEKVESSEVLNVCPKIHKLSNLSKINFNF